MAKQFLSEQQVKDVLGVENFYNLSPENIKKLTSLIPVMDKDVAMSIINQFPAYTECATIMITQLNEMCVNLEADKEDLIQNLDNFYRTK